LALAPSSDSGVQGDDVTDVTTPTITGTGGVGDTVDLYDGTTLVGTGTVGGAGTWGIATSALALGANVLTATETDLAGDVSAASTALSLSIVAPPTADFNGDGMSDVLWEYEDTTYPADPGNGQVAIWLMNGTTPTATPVIQQVPADWQVITTGDFSGNGMDDLLWEYENPNNPSDPNNGQVAIWMMNGPTPVSEQVIQQVPANWHAIATGDFSGNGMADIVWEYENASNPFDPGNGQVAVWMMNGTSAISEQVIQQVPASWHVVTTGDFLGNGKDDILWQNTNGQAAIWSMNGATPTAETVFASPPSNWHVIPG
jgi:uncharacterized protein (DUF427 family)